MGLFGSSKSSSTQNTTNTNYQVSSVDNSLTEIYNDQSQTTDISMSGQFAGVNTQGGNFTVTDGGAFDLVDRAFSGAIDLTRDTVGTMANLADAGFSLADSVTARSTNLADTLASYNATVARDSINSSTAIAGALLDFAREESEQSKNLSENTTRYALQAVDSISRSDGQQLGVASLETQKYVFIGLGVIGLAAVLLRAK